MNARTRFRLKTQALRLKHGTHNQASHGGRGGAVAQPGSPAATGGRRNDTTTISQLRKHPGYSASSLVQLRKRGHTNDEIAAMWSGGKGGGKGEQDASSMHREKVGQAKERLGRLDKKLDQHAKEQRAEPRNWGYVGDLGHTQEVLDGLLEGFGVNLPTQRSSRTSATDAYNTRRADVRARTSAVRSLIGRLSKTKNPNYGDVGDMGHINEVLQEALGEED